MNRDHNLWYVAGYYAADVAPPKRPGELAVEVTHRSESGARLEADVLESRADIGEVIITPPTQR